MTWMIWGIHSLGNLHMVLVHSLPEVFPALVRSEPKVCDDFEDAPLP